MHVEQSSGSGAFVEIVDVLGDDEEIAGPGGVEPGEGVVRRVGGDMGKLRAAGIVKGVDEGGIGGEAFGGGDGFDLVALPQPVGGAEGGDSALGRDAGAGENHDIVGFAHQIAPGSGRS